MSNAIGNKVRYQVLSASGERMGIYYDAPSAIERADYCAKKYNGEFSVEKREVIHVAAKPEG